VGPHPREGIGRAHLPTVGRATTLKKANDIITDYLDCKHKAYLSLSKAAGRTPDYEKFLKQQELQYRGGAISVLLGQGGRSHALHDHPITLADLEKGADIIPDVLLTMESMVIAVHCIKRSPGLSSLGPFHYEPVLFSCLDRASHQSHRFILAMACLALEQVQNFRPQHGTVISGAGYRRHRFKLNK
jgi:predicted RecB family nuclease